MARFALLGSARETESEVTKKTPSKRLPAAKAVKAKQHSVRTAGKPKAHSARAAAIKKTPAKTKFEAKKAGVRKHAKPVKPSPKPEIKPVKVMPKAAPVKTAVQKTAKAEPMTSTAAKAATVTDIKTKILLKLDTKAPVKKNGAGAPQEVAQPGTPAKEDPDAPLLDMSDAAVRKMVTRAKQRGYVTYDELNRVLPSDKVSSEQIEDTMAMLNEMGINVIESEEQEETEGEQVPAVAAGRQVAEVPEKPEETYDRTDDPVRMYLREMGSVELLSREGEIAIAKRIEAGRELMIGALCEGPLTFEALTVWRDELNEGKALLRDIIDLEAMYGGIPGAEGAPGQPPVRGAMPGMPGAMPGMPGAPPVPGPNGAPPMAAPKANFPPPPPPPQPQPVKPAPFKVTPPGETPEVAEGETPEGGEGAIPGDDDFDDESNLSPSPMEAALKPQVPEHLAQIS